MKLKDIKDYYKTIIGPGIGINKGDNKKVNYKAKDLSLSLDNKHAIHRIILDCIQYSQINGPAINNLGTISLAGIISMGIKLIKSGIDITDENNPLLQFYIGLINQRPIITPGQCSISSESLRFLMEYKAGDEYKDKVITWYNETLDKIMIYYKYKMKQKKNPVFIDNCLTDTIYNNLLLSTSHDNNLRQGKVSHKYNEAEVAAPKHTRERVFFLNKDGLRLNEQLRKFGDFIKIEEEVIVEQYHKGDYSLRLQVVILDEIEKYTKHFNKLLAINEGIYTKVKDENDQLKKDKNNKRQPRVVIEISFIGEVNAVTKNINYLFNLIKKKKYHPYKVTKDLNYRRLSLMPNKIRIIDNKKGKITYNYDQDEKVITKLKPIDIK